MSDERTYYDKRIYFIDRDYYSVGKLLSILGDEIHPPANFTGEKIPADSPKDSNREKRVGFRKILTDKLIKEIEHHRVIIKNEFEIIIESPIRRDDLNRARIYKSEIVIFCRSIGVKVVFKKPSERFFKKTVGDEEMLELIPYDIHVFSDDEDIQNERLSEPRSPHSLKEIEQDIPIKHTVKQVANYRELASAFKVVPNDEDKNLKWFRNRCSDVNDYPAFKEARVTPGRRGGSPSEFSVLIIAAHLFDKDLVKEWSLRTSIEKHFGDILPEFEDLICPPKD